MAKSSDRDTGQGTPEGSEIDIQAEDPVVRAVSPVSRRQDQIEVLQDVIGLKLKEIAYACGVSRESVRLWKRSDNGERPARYEDLRSIAERLLRDRTLDPLLIGAWFRSRNRGLGDRRPLEAIRAGAFEEVSDAAESFIALSAAAPGHARSGEEAPILERRDIAKAVIGADS